MTYIQSSKQMNYFSKGDIHTHMQLSAVEQHIEHITDIQQIDMTKLDSLSMTKHSFGCS